MIRVLKEGTFSGTTNPEAASWENEHRQIAREADEGIVLLKNEDQILPLKPGSAVAVYGAGAGRTIKGRTGSGDVMDFFTVYSTTPFIMPTGDPVKIPEADESADTAIYVLSRVAGEGADRNADKGDYYLKDDEHQMVEDLCKYYKNVIIVINAGGQVNLSFMDEFSNIKALMVIVQPGMEGGKAFADVISGKVNPSGKLVDSWAYKYEDYPSAATFSHNNGNVEKEFYEEGIYVGYRYFDTFGISVRYGFGYGLSYTTFEIQNASIKKEQTNLLKVSMSVKNTGAVAGKEVVQAYASLPGGSMEKEAHRLIAYAKTELLQPGEEQSITLEIPAECLTSYNQKKAAWVLEKVKNLFPLKDALKELEQPAGATCKREAVQAALAWSKQLPVLELKAAEFKSKKIVYRKNSELVASEAMEFVNILSVEELINLASGDPGKAQGGNHAGTDLEYSPD